VIIKVCDECGTFDNMVFSQRSCHTCGSNKYTIDDDEAIQRDKNEIVNWNYDYRLDQEHQDVEDVSILKRYED
jgi:hypothetical protein